MPLKTGFRFFHSASWGSAEGRITLCLLLMMGFVPNASAQGWWGFPPPPAYYYETAPEPEHERRSEPESRGKKPKAAKPKKVKEAPRRTEASEDSGTNEGQTGRLQSQERESSPRRAPAASAEVLESANPFGKPVSAAPAAGAVGGQVRETAPARTSDELKAGPAAEPNPSSAGGAAGEWTTRVWGNGDSLSRIAKAAGVSVNDILSENRLRASELREGQVLRLPPPQAASNSGSLSTTEAGLDREVWRGVRGKKRVALTFDAGSENDAALDLLNYLREWQVPASFFVTGEFVKKNPELIREMAAGGFPIHNHSWSHPEFTGISDEEIADQLARTEDVVASTAGVSTKPYWRPPFGDRDRRVLRAAAAAGYQSIYWTLDSLDSVGEKKSADFIIERVTNPPKSGGDPDSFLDGAIVLMHIGEPTTVEAVPEVVRNLRERGFTFVTVAEILKP